jgi:type IV secretory pathway VirB10-like protein
VGIVIGVVFMIITAVFLVWRLLGKEHTDSDPKNPEQEQTIVAPNPNNNQEIENLHNQLRKAELEQDKLNSQGSDSNPPTTNNKTTGDKKEVQGASGGKDNKSESETKTGSQEPAKDTKVEEKGGKDNKSESEAKTGSQESAKDTKVEEKGGKDNKSESETKKGS